MREVKCECGHINPYGASFCESCGKPFAEGTEKLDMRYEGTARRSVVYKKGIIDRIWNFFSSVKVAIGLILVTLVASGIGTIYPQEMYIPGNADPSVYYQDTYGVTGQIYYLLGFHNLYGSWWYMLMVASIGVSLVICSLDRVIPLYKALKKQRVKRHQQFIKRQRLVSVTPNYNEEEVKVLVEKIKKKGYTVREEDGHYLAEKGRFSRWGPYVNHIGLIIFLVGVMLRSFPNMYMEESMWIREGDTKPVVGTNGEYYIENHKFILETYDKDEESSVFGNAIDKVGDNAIAKNFQTNVTLYKRVDPNKPATKDNLEKVKDYSIKVNEPLKFESHALYQVDYKLDELKTMSFFLEDKKTEKQLGKIDVDLFNPKEEYDLGNGNKVQLVSYFPDFYFDEDGNPNTQTKIPTNPAFVFKMFTPSTPEGEVSFVAIKENIEPSGTNNFKMAFAGIETRNVTGLTVKVDKTLWILVIGGTIFMIGVIQGMYWNHRRIWLHRNKNEMWIAAFTNKNWYGIQTEMKKIFEGTSFEIPIDKDKKNEVESA
ncbi:MAG: cytochrome c biogenesis protein ResB [Bacillaceae bacterium]